VSGQQYDRQIPDPRELPIRQIPGGVPGGGMVTLGIDSCIELINFSTRPSTYYSHFASEMK
jgi:hypothetical protein